MKILALSPSPILPSRRGLEHRIYHFLKPLCARHQITHLSFIQNEPMTGKDAERLAELFEKVSMIEPSEPSQPPAAGLIGRIREWFFPPSVDFGGMRSSASMEREFARLVTEDSYDLIFIASPYMLNYVLDEKDHPVVYDAIDDSSLLFKREIALQKGLVAKLRAYKDWLIVRRAEQKFYSRFKEITITSDVDAACMKKLCPDSNITVIPLGVDAHAFDRDLERAEKPTVLFTGVMDYAPNKLAMTYFCREVLPLIERRLPDVKLLIVGRSPDDETIQLGRDYKNVTVTGAVDDIAAYFAIAWVYVCPLISGAGIKTKLLEAWAAKVPIVATSLSCDGLNVSPGEDMLVADGPEPLADGVVTLIRDRELAQKLSQAGKRKILSDYDWESKAAELEQIFNKAVSEFRQN